MLYIAEVPVKCPNCGVKFNSRQLPVLFDTGYRNSELRQDFRGRIQQMEHYAVVSCPSCGRADWSSAFEPTNEPAVLSAPNTPTHLQFRAAAIGAEREGRDFFNAGLFYLHAAWCADDARAFPQAREYRKLAADAFSKSLVDISCPVDRRPEINYLIGELLRRAGDFEAARAHFNQVLPGLPSRFAIMARKLMRLCESRSIEAIDFETDGGVR
jgi:uncharacterized protein (DUF2225 family)